MSVHEDHKKQNYEVSTTRILRAVASSTAIETGESVAVVEERLKSGSTKFNGLRLAD